MLRRIRRSVAMFCVRCVPCLRFSARFKGAQRWQRFLPASRMLFSFRLQPAGVFAMSGFFGHGEPRTVFCRRGNRVAQKDSVLLGREPPYFFTACGQSGMRGEKTAGLWYNWRRMEIAGKDCGLDGDVFSRVLFVSFCAEMFARRHGIAGGEAMRRFVRDGVCEFLCDCYSTLHTQSGEAILDDVELFMANKGGG